MQLKIVPINSIKVPERFRTDFGDTEQLKQSIKDNGLIHPIAVREEGDGFTLLAGERRLRACRELGHITIPTRVYERELGELGDRTIELAENLDRKDFDWREKVLLQKRIHELQLAIHGPKTSTSPDADGWSKRDTATLLGRSPASVTQDLQLADALEIIPGLAECKTKDDASKLVRQMHEQLLRSELAKRVEADEAGLAVDVKKKKLIESYILGDAITGLQSLPSKTVNLIDLDPPYGIDLNQMAKGIRSGFHATEEYHEVQSGEYLTWIEPILRESYRVLIDSGWLILWFAPDPWATPLWELLTKVGFEAPRRFAVWNKSGGSNQCLSPETNLASAWEPFYYCRKPGSTIFKQGHPNVFNVKQVPPQNKTHPTEKPVELLQEIFDLFSLPGATILVPFLGSGNSLLAASNLRSTSFGWDLSAKYRNDFILKVHGGIHGSYRSL